MPRRVRLGEHDYSNPDLEALYEEVFEPESPTLLVRPDLEASEWEALRAEAECYAEEAPRDGMKFCYSPVSYEGMDPERLAALRRRVESLRPDWVRLIRLAVVVDNDLYTIVHYSGVPPYPAVAILENMVRRGELPRPS